MTVTIKKIALAEQQPANNEGTAVNANYLDLIGNIEIECFVRLGTLNLTIAELKQLKEDQLFTLAQKTSEPVDLVLNNQVIARGELMSCEECFALKITEVSA
ncbi:FliM/FliN family flagellar motor switch protein [Legionella dresdenensis]|uniref:Flagellar motor switch protein FliN n=1 Tax=Legionella dresdenensis TaxID=450200 RepID=A0ABV8CGP4_9GAMM